MSINFNVNIQCLGKILDIFSFYRYLISKLESKHHIFLESVEENTHNPMYSFIGIEPDYLVKAIDDKIDIFEISSEQGEIMKDYYETHKEDKISEYLFSDNNKNSNRFKDQVKIHIPVFDQLQRAFPISRNALPELFPQKIFSGGLLGYIGYDVISSYVGYEINQEQKEKYPQLLLGLFSQTLAYSHTTHTLYYIENQFSNNSKPNIIPYLFEKYKNLEKEINSKGSNIDKIKGINSEFIPRVKMTKKQIKSYRNILKKEDLNNFKSNISEEKWGNVINKAKNHILDGDIIQIVLSRQLQIDSDIDPLLIYEVLRILNPSPYLFHINFEGVHNGDIRLFGSSPEALITKTHTTLETVPIAGTRRRGRTPADEKKMEHELLTSEKERAEHLMLVDLARNDLAKVSIPGTVETYNLMELKKYPNVMHLISNVRSRSEKHPFAILKSMFPAGTVSGAPKLRAMQLINELEPISRGPYAGVVGYLSFAGDMDMAIAIRTIFNKNKTYVAQAGAGIVADSNAHEEYIETANKMHTLLATLAVADKFQK